MSNTSRAYKPAAPNNACLWYNVLLDVEVTNNYFFVKRIHEFKKAPVGYQYIKIFSVRPSVCDGCGRGRNGFVGRVQKHHVRFSFHRSFHKNGHNLS